MIDYVILTAVSNEATYFIERYDAIAKISQLGFPYHMIEIGNYKVAIVVSGIGTTFTAAMSTAVIYEFQPKAVFFSGSAGTIQQDRQIGDIIIVEQAYEVEIQGLAAAFKGTEYEQGLILPGKDVVQPSIFEADKSLLDLAKQYAATHTATVGMAASTNQFPSPKSLFAAMLRSGAAAIDMETSALYQTGWLYNMPVLAFRCISNKLSATGDYVAHDEPLAGSEMAAAKYTADFIHAL